MTIVRVVHQGEVLPKYYGIAWTDWRSRDAYCLPVGLNLIAAMLRGGYLWLRTAPYEVPLDPRAAFEAGLRASEAYQQGVYDTTTAYRMKTAYEAIDSQIAHL